MAKLRKNNVGQAWAGTFDGIFHKDLSSANARLAKDCRAYGQGFLAPFGSINPKLPDWQEDLRRCQEEHRMPGIRLHPNYHGYKLDDPAFRDLCKLATARKLIVQLAVCMEDERTQHPLVRVPPVDLAPLAGWVSSEPQLRLVLLNCYPTFRLETLRTLAAAGEIYLDFAMLERVGTVARLAEQVGFPRVLFGSNYPLYYLEPALLKARESGLTETQTKAVFEDNARRLLAR
ncbi:MAG: amidohydrolase family protein [Acidobacteria bacterium]|nr:amidohydrolase family protein [Acidobacteriota bacterium]